MISLFQLSTRRYDDEIQLVKKAMDELEEKCSVKSSYKIGQPFNRAGWTFFDLEISTELAQLIETSGMLEGALGYRIGEQLKNFIGHHLESFGSQVRVKQIEYD
ncbi:MAG TPA: hypothetical protein HA292_01165 [Candidatus Nitrosotenuis sp.]|jgi:hypothetical protein|nr:hypothetical protein [Candidatus Nitrosotenuis sp.]HIH68109.1 hypothetical protein [Candidatus Nitrosotenuis sp.]HII04153.1 hypothetical protein [Candidatus Nitrosotenuis sp.]